MRKIQIQLDRITDEALRRLAFLGRRVAATIRDVLHRKLGAPFGERRQKALSFVDAGSSRDPYPVSEEHDRALAEGEW